jgi:hypothetical protein
LYDRLDHYAAAASTAPDDLMMLYQRADTSISVDAWSAKNEKNDSSAVANSDQGACRMIPSRRL